MENDSALYNAWRAQHKNSVNLGSDQNRDKTQQIVESSLATLRLLESWPKNLPVPQDLLKAAGSAIGQFSFFSAYTLQSLEYIVQPYLKNGILIYDDLKSPRYEYKFGLSASSRRSTDPNLAQIMANGQRLSMHYHLNWPLHFNRLLTDFDGEFLLLGGGATCECEAPQERHPQNIFYNVDIDNAHEPDLVAHGGYLPHLYYFPPERFSFIWFEHYSPGELIDDIRVLQQYFRMAKPGGIFLFQSNFLVPGLVQVSNKLSTHEAVTKEVFDEFAARLLKYKFSILENKILQRADGQRYVQMVVMKPMHVHDGPVFKVENGPIFNFDENILSQFRKPTDLEEASALMWSKVLSKQTELGLRFPLENILSWVDDNTVSTSQNELQ